MFKIGDKVKRVGEDFRQVKHGHIYIISQVDYEDKELQLQGMTGNYVFSKFKKVENLERPKTELEWLDRVQQNFKG